MARGTSVSTKQLLATVPLVTMEPFDVDLAAEVDSGLPPSGRRMDGMAAVYVPDGADVSIEVADLGSGPVRVWRFDPTAASLDVVAELDSNAVFHSQPDAANHAGDTDWIYILEFEDEEGRWPMDG